MTSGENHPNDITRQIITNYFLSRVPRTLGNQVIDCPNGYIIQEIRPQTLQKDEVSPHPFAKLSYDKDTGMWTVYWRRASTKWNALGHFPDLAPSLEFIKSNPNGCFFG